MQISKTSKWLYISISLWLLTILTLGFWWLYVAYKLAQTIEENQIHNIIGENFYNMIKWEGISFFILLLIISFTVIILFFKDLRKSRSMQNFFASLSHELKTPLANIKLQSEFLNELLAKDKSPQVEKCLNFLLKGSYELEEQFDNMLQLSRIEQDAQIPLKSINLLRFIQSFTGELPNHDYQFEIHQSGSNFDILADEFALKVILRNLVENTKRHSKSKDKKISISLKEKSPFIQLQYYDHGEKFDGQIDKLGSLFYKHISHQGSGIGLYLIKKISEKMGGRFQIINKQGSLEFQLELLKT